MHGFAVLSALRVETWLLAVPTRGDRRGDLGTGLYHVLRSVLVAV